MRRRARAVLPRSPRRARSRRPWTSACAHREQNWRTARAWPVVKTRTRPALAMPVSARRVATTVCPTRRRRWQVIANAFQVGIFCMMSASPVRREPSKAGLVTKHVWCVLSTPLSRNHRVPRPNATPAQQTRPLTMRYNHLHVCVWKDWNLRMNAIRRAGWTCTLTAAVVRF